MASDQTTVIIVAIVLVVVLVAILILLSWRCMYKKWSHSIHKFDKLSDELKGESTQDSYEVRLSVCSLHLETQTNQSSFRN